MSVGKTPNQRFKPTGHSSGAAGGLSALDFMNIYMRYLGIVLFLFSAAAAGQSQADLTVSSCNEYRQAESRLAELYEKALKFNEDDQKLVAAIRRSQAAWLSYVQAELGAIYPEDYKGGSAELMCRCEEQLALINARIEQIARWVYVQEGDVCAGSRSG